MGNAASTAPPRSPLFAPIDTRAHARTAHSSASGKDAGKRSQVEQRRKEQAAARAAATISSSSEDDDGPVACSARAQLRRAMQVTESLQAHARVMEQKVTLRDCRCRLFHDETSCVWLMQASIAAPSCGVLVLALAVTRRWQQEARRVRLEKELQREHTENERLRLQVVVVAKLVLV
jgi:hypothetical protein